MGVLDLRSKGSLFGFIRAMTSARHHIFGRLHFKKHAVYNKQSHVDVLVGHRPWEDVIKA